MTTAELTTRIDAATAKIAKTEKTIERKRAAIAKETAVIVNEGFAETATFKEVHIAGNIPACYAALNIEHLNDDIRRLTASIADAEKLIAKYRAALAAESENAAIEVPPVVSLMETELVRIWDEQDEERGESNHTENVRDAHALVIDLVKRVAAAVGTVESWANVHAEQGNRGATLNGYVTGDKGRAKVESVVAGGYNVQKLHIRTIVSKF